MSSQIILKLSQQKHLIHFAQNSKEALSELLATNFKARQWIIVSNPTVYKLHGKALEKRIAKLGEVNSVLIPDGEKYKTLASLEKLYKNFLKYKVDRKTPIIAFGGGVVGDVAGYAAATFLRGLPLIQIPTTLLAQVDSSVGGKTAVDLPEGKNLVGAFYQPHLVYIDVAYLKTLPKREVLCGTAEVIKYGAIKKANLFEKLEQNIQSFINLDEKILREIVRDCVATKADVVQRDEKETKGLRLILNFGHTLGHAVETLSGYKKMSHGEGVALGMAFAVALSKKMGLCSSEVETRLRQLMQKAGFNLTLPAFSSQRYIKIMARDKKMEAGEIQYVLLKKIGQSLVQKLKLDFVEKELRQFLKGT